jgi:shikimate kinase
MAVIGKGQAHGACSLLHAAGLGYGCSMALDLPVAVRLLDRESKRSLSDPDGLLEAVVNVWITSGHELPNGLSKEDLHWAVASKVPPRQGLKSSAAVSIAALRALCDSTNLELEDKDLVLMSAQAQLESGVSITGSIDDSWACATKGWKLIDVNAETIEEGILMEGAGPPADDWFVLILARGERESRPDPESFAVQQQNFVQAINAIQEGQELVALTWNGRAMVGILSDSVARKLTNDAFVNGARAAGMSGSGSAIVLVAPSISKPSCERLKQWYTTRYPDVELIEVKFLNADNVQDEIE